MKNKITLTIQQAVLERANSYAEKIGISLFHLVENYLESVTKEISANELSPNLKMLVGALKLPIDFNEKRALRIALEKKHL